MNKFVPGGIFVKSVEDGDISAVKTGLVNYIHFDPMFKTSDFKNALEYVKSKNINIEVPYVKEIDEYVLENQKDWNRQYFFLLTEWLRLNFAVEKRVPHIREVGRVVFKDHLKSNQESNIIEKKIVTTPIIKERKNTDFQKAPIDRGSKKKKVTINLIKVALAAGVVIAIGLIIAMTIQN